MPPGNMGILLLSRIIIDFNSLYRAWLFNKQKGVAFEHGANQFSIGLANGPSAGKIDAFS